VTLGSVRQAELRMITEHVSPSPSSPTVHLDIIKVLLPTDAQENCFKRSIKIYINLLTTKRRLLHLKTQSVPRCKHFSSLL
jgi:hypothetical protein